MRNNYTVFSSDSILEIKSKKIIISDLFSYFVFFSVAIYFILNLIIITSKYSVIFQISLSIIISIPFSFLFYRITETKIKLTKTGCFIFFENIKININQIEEICVEQYISSDLVTGISSISLKTNSSIYKILKSVRPKELDFFLNTITSFINSNSLKITYSSK